ncbi:hypothetical protein GCM10008949_51030 [Deinococcus humi]|nr:hypothetical protein GCM10008949_51030 [Deinococcus humi]
MTLQDDWVSKASPSVSRRHIRSSLRCQSAKLPAFCCAPEVPMMQTRLAAHVVPFVLLPVTSIHR